MFPGFAYQLGNLIASRNAPDPGGDRRGERRQLWAGAGDRRGGRGGRAGDLDDARPGAARRRFRRGGTSVKATIWHNPRCSKSRETLAILNDTPGVEVEVIDYLNHPPSRDELKALYAAAGLTPREGLRTARGRRQAAQGRERRRDPRRDGCAADPDRAPARRNAQGRTAGPPARKRARNPVNCRSGA